MKSQRIFILIVIMFCSGIVAWAEDYIACYSSIEEWQSSPGVIEGERRAYLKILNRSKDTMKVQIDKYMPPFPEYFTVTVDAKLHSRKYTFTFIDGWDNEGKGFFKFEDDTTVELSIEMTKKSDNLSSVGRLYGKDKLSKCVGEEYTDVDFWKTATVEQIKAALNSGELKLTYHTGDGETVFMLAAESSPYPEVIQELIKAGADINARSNGSYEATALMYAAKYNYNSAILSELIKAGANVNARDRSFITVLMYAADGGNSETIKALLKAGATVDDLDYGDQTVLMHYLRFNRHPDITTIKALLTAGADVNAKSNERKTALMIAAEYSESPEAILALLKAGADPSIKNDDGKTAWDYIQKNKALLNTKAYKALERAQKATTNVPQKNLTKTVILFILFGLIVQFML